MESARWRLTQTALLSRKVFEAAGRETLLLRYALLPLRLPDFWVIFEAF